MAAISVMTEACRCLITAAAFIGLIKKSLCPYDAFTSSEYWVKVVNLHIKIVLCGHFYHVGFPGNGWVYRMGDFIFPLEKTFNDFVKRKG